MPKTPLIFDLDGTLVDSVYLHAAAFQHVFARRNIPVPIYEIHRRIGMTGELMLRSLSDAFDFSFDEATIAAIESEQAEIYKPLRGFSRALPGAREIWATLAQRDIPFAIASSAGLEDAKALCSLIAYPQDAILITAADRSPSKPAPGPFAIAAKRLHVDIEDAIIVGDSIWDMMSSRRARSLGIGVLTGGYGREELHSAGAFRVYRDIAEIGRKLEELGL